MKNISPSAYALQIQLIPKEEFFSASEKEELPVFEFLMEVTREEMLQNSFLNVILKQVESALTGNYISERDLN